MSNLEKLKSVYAKNLAQAHASKPEDYVWPIEELPTVLERMYAAIDKMSFNKDGHAWKLTCKELGIPHTYKAIEEFIKRDAT